MGPLVGLVVTGGQSLVLNMDVHELNGLHSFLDELGNLIDNTGAKGQQEK